MSENKKRYYNDFSKLNPYFINYIFKSIEKDEFYDEPIESNLLYMATNEDVALNELTLLEEKWNQKIRCWNQILSHLSIYFAEIISYLIM